jgi:transcriptional regulator with XRE-family HTH domain
VTAVDSRSAGAESTTESPRRSSVMVFGSLLRRFRADAQLTQEELAERSGLRVRAIADAESGRTNRPQRRSVQMLADALGLAEPERAALAAFSRGQRRDPGELLR